MLIAQDTIYTKRNEKIISKVLEINLESIVYKDFDNLDGPTIMLDKADVIKIVYANGKTFYIEKNEYAVTQDVEVRNRKQAIKFEFFSPLTNDLCFGYERQIKVGTNIEVKAAVIGPGVSRSDRNADGFFLKAGVKFLPGSDFVIKGMEYAHGMRGRYIKPELTFSNYAYNYTVYTGTGNLYNTERVKVSNFAINIVYGKQVILGQRITLDWYVGLGYGWQNTTLKNNSSYDYIEFDPYAFSHVYMGQQVPITLSTGMTIGWLC